MIMPSSLLIQRRGATLYSAAGNGAQQTIVSALANTTGILIRTIYLLSPTTTFLDLQINGAGIISVVNGGIFNFIGTPILVPAGQALQFQTGAVGGSCNLTYDVLP